MMNPEAIQWNQRDVPLSDPSGNKGLPNISRKRFPG